MNCDFLPLPDWSYRRIIWPVSDDTVGSQSLMRSPECRIVLMHEIQRLAYEGDPGVHHVIGRTDKRFAPLTASIIEILQVFIDKYGLSNTAIGKPQSVAESVKVLRRTFNETSDIFGSLPDYATGRRIRGRNPYRVLVDAHLSISVENAHESYETKDTFKPFKALRAVSGYSLFRCKLLQLCVERRERLVKQFISEGGNVAMDLDRGQIEGLWWVLMLRAICWWLSVDVESSTSNVPSKYYYSQMPVFLT